MMHATTITVHNVRDPCHKRCENATRANDVLKVSTTVYGTPCSTFIFLIIAQSESSTWSRKLASAETLVSSDHHNRTNENDSLRVSILCLEIKDTTSSLSSKLQLSLVTRFGTRSRYYSLSSIKLGRLVRCTLNLDSSSRTNLRPLDNLEWLVVDLNRGAID